MRATIVNFAAASLVALTLAACSDKQELAAPKAPRSPNAAVVLLPPRPSPNDFVEITAGDYHTCARKVNGNVYCWGSAVEGQVGGQPSGPCSPEARITIPCWTQPKLVSWPAEFTTATQISAGGNHTCALVSGGAAFCWGSNDVGELALNGFGGFSYEPVRQTAGTGVFSSISAGRGSTCVTSSSGVFCWGMAGNPSNPAQGVYAPARMTPFAGYTTVAAGTWHACFPTDLGGSSRAIDCGGSNLLGQAGQYWLNFPQVPYTLRTALGTAVSRVSAKSDFNCADLQNGTVQCFGNNDHGQLGNGSVGGKQYLPQAVGGSGSLLHGVSVGVQHACALEPLGFADCWGRNDLGQVGTNVLSWQIDVASPAGAGFGMTFRAIAAGLKHTCAIGTDNHIYCWGDNSQHQLGTYLIDHATNLEPIGGGYTAMPVQAMDPK